MENIENHGVIADPRTPEEKSLDRVMGSELITKGSIVVADSNWIPYLSRLVKERQNKQGVFDTLSCVTFSAGHIIEAQLLYMMDNAMIPPEALKWLTDEGYIVNGVPYISKRYTAIRSNTTKQGNYFQAVWNSFRHNGVLPDKDFPFGGNSWEEYHDKSKITPAMDAKAKKFLEYFEIAYEVVYSDDQVGFSVGERENTQKALKSAPLHIAIPIPSGHAIVQGNLKDTTYGIMNTYPEFITEYPINSNWSGIQYCAKGIVTVKSVVVPQKPKHLFPVDLKYGMRNDDVKALQECLQYDGTFPKGTICTGYFGDITLQAVKAFQNKYKYEILVPAGVQVATGICGKFTRQKLNALFS